MSIMTMTENIYKSHAHVKLTESEFNKLSKFIHMEYGIKMPPIKTTMLEARLQKRLKTLNFDSFTDYSKYLFSPEGVRDELVHMVDMITTNKTDFFRESTHFDYLVRHAELPADVDQHVHERDARSFQQTAQKAHTWGLLFPHSREAGPRVATAAVG